MLYKMSTHVGRERKLVIVLRGVVAVYVSCVIVLRMVQYGPKHVGELG